MHSSFIVAAFCACFLVSLKLRASVGHTDYQSLRLRKHNIHTATSVVESDASRFLHELDNALRHKASLHGGNEQGALTGQSINNFRRSKNGEASHLESDNVFQREDASASYQLDGIMSRRAQIANATQFLDIKSSIRACECDGTACIAEPEVKHVGDSIMICLWSNFLDIASVSNMTLHVGDVWYQPVVNGTINKLTKVTYHGKLAVITTMTISSFYQHPNPDDLRVDATVSFVPAHGRRKLADIPKFLVRNRKLLLDTSFDESAAAFAGATCLLAAIAILSASAGALIAAMCRRDDSTSFRHEYNQAYVSMS